MNKQTQRLISSDNKMLPFRNFFAWISGVLLFALISVSCSTTAPVVSGSGFIPTWYESSNRSSWTSEYSAGTGYAVASDSLEALDLARESALRSLRTAVHERMEALRKDAVRALTNGGTERDADSATNYTGANEENETSANLINPNLLSAPQTIIALRNVVDTLPLQNRREQTSSHKTDQGIYHQFVQYQYTTPELQKELQRLLQRESAPEQSLPSLNYLLEQLQPN